MNIEEALREIEEKAALLRYVADAAASNPETPDPKALAGIADVSGDLETLARAVKRALGPTTLAGELARS